MTPVVAGGAMLDFLRLFREGLKYRRPDVDALKQSDDNRVRYATYHRRIFWSGAIWTILFAVAGPAALLQEAIHNNIRHNAFDWLEVVLVSGAAGLFFGVAVACLFAPRDFLEGPVGSRWMRMIGTKSVGAARLVCLVVALAPWALVGWVALMYFLSSR
jgi:hypothetical protein